MGNRDDALPTYRARDTELGGRPIRTGDKVVIWFASADYDDAVFADPFVFDIRRSPNPQVAFGLMSPHLCLGAQLARMEIKILFQESSRDSPEPRSWGRSNACGATSSPASSVCRSSSRDEPRRHHPSPDRLPPNDFR